MLLKECLQLLSKPCSAVIKVENLKDDTYYASNPPEYERLRNCIVTKIDISEFDKSFEITVKEEPKIGAW